jgi:hypothetical protein
VVLTPPFTCLSLHQANTGDRLRRSHYPRSPVQSVDSWQQRDPRRRSPGEHHVWMAEDIERVIVAHQFSLRTKLLPHRGQMKWMPGCKQNCWPNHVRRRNRNSVSRSAITPPSHPTNPQQTWKRPKGAPDGAPEARFEFRHSPAWPLVQLTDSRLTGTA